ncbi:hypothetical protein, conserved [Trypanosoma brucei brucei TREU927]|uniref:Uncharacterized protein n=1 Tax=Trypanosoma brucei brucei (strain 927/4 GUTat10.1) TaxID=185431 RepID=Q57Y47_TRYB2|nr:hypothetical protein, conserved [Trypanosoma brucei brucei TREU927]AAX69472.1 hypothetical protein, conserved [Trypanosoma brucei]AAZ12743.1 hypothetical protein, conserved [Trypanosoma brucei brucei TREU927]
MGGDGNEAVNEGNHGEPSTPHTFSVNATPFEPGSSGSSYPADKWQEQPGVQREQSAVMGSSTPWTPSPLQYYDMFMLTPHVRAMAQMNVMLPGGPRRYSGTPIVRTSSPGRKSSSTSEEVKKAEKGSLSIHAKPWSPTPDSGLSQKDGDTYIQLKKGWTKVDYHGAPAVAPVPFMEMSSLFVHSLTVRPLDKPRIHLEIFNYLCARCATKSFFGRLTCRGPDVILKFVADDVPPLRVAHLIEQVTGATVSALFTETIGEYELWLERSDTASHVIDVVSGALWTCPMFHGYAVYAKCDDEKTFLRDYINSLVEGFPEQTPYPMRFVTATASGAVDIHS